MCHKKSSKNLQRTTRTGVVEPTRIRRRTASGESGAARGGESGEPDRGLRIPVSAK
jgi:hypothetical protein